MARNDPFWMLAKFTGGNCPTCKKEHKKGDRIYFYPIGKKAYCAADSCGVKAHTDFLDHSEGDTWTA